MFHNPPGRMRHLYCACGGHWADWLTSAQMAGFEARFKALHNAPGCKIIGKFDWEHRPRERADGKQTTEDTESTEDGMATRAAARMTKMEACRTP
ncbi:MAG TPA: hypothetical protein P5137_04390, partial [Candidatus Brocadiia bacterium]|nr:hypothetical protein [Candidatus Brocadiia bacterium]